MIGRMYDIGTDATEAQIPIALFGMDLRIA